MQDFLRHRHILTWLVFLVLTIALVISWLGLREHIARWGGVPPAPKQAQIQSGFLGDDQFAYRSLSLMLQNLGDSGGQVTHFNLYNYEDLAKWMGRLASLDERSSFVPFLAANYYGAATKADKFEPLIQFLDRVGRSNRPEAWRWSVRAIFLARYRAKDLDLAYDLAVSLSRRARKNASQYPAWVIQMPAFILKAQGEKDAAIALLLETLASSAHSMHPNEVAQTYYYICTELLEKKQAQSQPFCQLKLTK